MRIGKIVCTALLAGASGLYASTLSSNWYQQVCLHNGGCQYNQSNTGPADVPFNDLSQSDAWESVSATMYGDAAPDLMHAYVQAAVSAFPPPGNTPAYGGVVYSNLGFTSADDFLFSSSTLPMGTPVTFEISASLDSTLATMNAPSPCTSGAPTPAGLAYLQGFGGGPQIFDLVHNTCPTNSGSDQMSFTGTFQSTVGGDFPFTVLLVLHSLDGYLTAATSSSSVTVNASDTADITVQVLTPGVTFSSASGSSYAAPEPGDWVMLAGGLGGLLAIRARRTRAARRAARLSPLPIRA